MITQILGVALISLLTITPTIQQNNIEQLIAPNIEIQQNSFNSNTNYTNQIWVKNNFSYYHNATNTRITTYDTNLLLTNFTNYFAGNINHTTIINDSNTGGGIMNVHIIDGNFYIYDTSLGIFGGSASNMTGNVLRSLIRDYYLKVRGGLPTSETFGFTQTTDNLVSTSTFYTYSLNGSQGSVNGRVYVRDLNLLQTNNSYNVTNNSISAPTNTSLQQIIENQIQPLETYSQDQVTLYYWFDSPIPLNQAGTYIRNLFSRDSYGTANSYGQITINLIQDSISPTITGITGNPTNWTNQPVTITVNATDNVGLNATAYSFDGGQTWQQSNQLTTSIMQILEIRVRDTSGNIASQQVTINRIDTSSPAINLAGNWKNTFELGELANNQALLGYLSISDNLSGLNNGLTTISNFNYNQAGSYSNIQVSATDNAGNNFVYTLPTVTITQPADNTGPIITGPTVVNRTQGNITTQGILDLYSITDISGVEPNTISIRDLNNNIITNWSPYTVGSYQLRVYARDTLNNITQYQFTLQVGEAPPPDLTPPTIVGPLLVSFEIGTYTSNTEILNLYTFSDNVGILQNQLIGQINYSEFGDYPVTIRSTDTSNNVTNRNIVVRIRDEVVLGNYNPLTDLLSGIFGGALSMIFTIGTINVLGLRLLDAMGVIILGAVLLFVYKAIKGGS
jgi:hypothetical protein